MHCPLPVVFHHSADMCQGTVKLTRIVRDDPFDRALTVCQQVPVTSFHTRKADISSAPRAHCVAHSAGRGRLRQDALAPTCNSLSSRWSVRTLTCEAADRAEGAALCSGGTL